MTKHEALPLGWKGAVEKAWNSTSLRPLFKAKPGKPFGLQAPEVQEMVYEFVQKVLGWTDDQRENQVESEGQDPEPLQRPDDEKHYEKLRALGKSPKCSCPTEWRFGQNGPYLTLDYRISCPVHYPMTASLLRKADSQ